MNKKIRFLTIVIIMFLFTGNLSILSFGAENTTGFAGGEGTAQDPYRISTYEQLLNVQNHLNAHFLQTNDITVNGKWSPLGESIDYAFTGVYDGGGFEIRDLRYNNINSSGINLYIGLFGYNKGNIKNVFMRDCSFSGTSDVNAYIGSIAGVNQGKIEDCNVESNKSWEINKRNYTGGIVGENKGTIIRCNSNIQMKGTVSYRNDEDGDIYTGGIVGSNASGIVSYCVNWGESNISLKSSDIYENKNTLGIYSGGVSGLNLSLIENSYNCGNVINSGSSEAFSKIYACSGGIAAQSSGIIHSSFNCGSISASLKTSYNGSLNQSLQKAVSAYAGGIAARLNGKPSYVENCYNIGSVSASTLPILHDAIPNSSVYVGGIIGNARGVGGTSSNISNCYNSGSLSGESIVKEQTASPSTSGNVFLGEIAGAADSSAKGTNLYWVMKTGQSSTQVGIGNGTISSMPTASRTDIQCKNNTFVNILNTGKGKNTNWVLSDSDSINKGYPTFEYMLEKVESVTANPFSGEIVRGSFVTLNTNTKDAVIRYTTDESEPSILSGVYTAPIQILENTTLKAKAFKNGMADSETSTFTYQVISDAPVFFVDKVSGRPGEEIEVSVNIMHNPGIATFTLQLNFDKTKLTPVSITQAENLNVGMITSNIQASGDLSQMDYISAFWTNASNYTENGKLYHVKFKVKENLSDCSIPLTLSVGTIANQTLDDITVSVISGEVEIFNTKLGDINGDNLINGKDAVMLAQYITGGFGIEFSQIQIYAADVYPDANIDGKDAILLAQYLASWPVELGKK